MSEVRPGRGQSTAAAAVLQLRTSCPHPSPEHAQSAAGTTMSSNRQQQQQQQKQQQHHTHTTRLPTMMSSHIFLLSAVLLVLARTTATAQYFETKVYSDGACRSLASTSIINGAYGRTGVEAFGVCTNMTGSGTGYSSSMFQCNDSEAILTYYESDTCISGDEDVSGVMSNVTCNEDNRSSRCKTGDHGWNILSDWTVDATFYADATCSTHSGDPAHYSMSQVLQVYGVDTCYFSSSALYVALRCIDGVLGTVSYAASDPTCSSNFTIAHVVASACSASIFGRGSYMIATCSESSTGDSDTSTDEDGSSDGFSLRMAGGGVSYGWSIAAAAAATVLSIVL